MVKYGKLILTNLPKYHFLNDVEFATCLKELQMQWQGSSSYEVNPNRFHVSKLRFRQCSSFAWINMGTAPGFCSTLATWRFCLRRLRYSIDSRLLASSRPSKDFAKPHDTRGKSATPLMGQQFCVSTANARRFRRLADFCWFLQFLHFL